MAISIATRCLKCGRDSSFEQRDVFVGPLRDEIVTKTEERDGISCIIDVERLYTGKILRVHCPYCVLRISIADDLAPWSLTDHLLNLDPNSADLDLKPLFHVTPAHSKLRDFPLRCPRCDEEIAALEMGKLCLECGSNQLQVLGRDDLVEHKFAEQGDARQPTTALDSKSEGNEKPNEESEGRSL